MVEPVGNICLFKFAFYEFSYLFFQFGGNILNSLGAQAS